MDAAGCAGTGIDSDKRLVKGGDKNIVGLGWTERERKKESAYQIQSASFSHQNAHLFGSTHGMGRGMGLGVRVGLITQRVTHMKVQQIDARPEDRVKNDELCTG